MKTVQRSRAALSLCQLYRFSRLVRALKAALSAFKNARHTGAGGPIEMSSQGCLSHPALHDRFVAASAKGAVFERKK